MKRLHGLDALRGIAALSVVAWHWRHFYELSPANWHVTQQPFFWALRPLYQAGWMAVDLFFSLSGFVFFWLYADAIRTRKVGAGTFALLRFSRLYPLHLAMLLVVVALQFFFRRQTGHFFIYDAGDPLRFGAALGMAQQWLPPTMVQMFDGPAWSVSIEILLYIVFFAVCRARLISPGVALVIAAAAMAAFLLGANGFVARGLMGFFVGGAVFHGVEWARARPEARHLARVLAGLALCVWAATLAENYHGGVLHAVVYGLARHISPDAMRFSIARNEDVFLLPFVFIVSPLTIAALALYEHVHGARWAVLSFLGDISYSTYMLHFPLQLCLALAAPHFGWVPRDFMHPLAMIGFFAGLIVLGAASHYYFERPLQAFIRASVRRRTIAMARMTESST